MQDKIGGLIIKVVTAVIAFIIIVVCAFIFGFINTSGCYYRYNFDDSGNFSTSTKIANTTTIRADGNYQQLGQSQPSVTGGKWKNTGIIPSFSQTINVTVDGTISLCKAYLPINNLRSSSDKDSSNSLIEIPRVEDSSDPLSLYFDASISGWRNITELFYNDKLIVSISPSKTSGSSTFYDVFTKSYITADCNTGRTSYSPICGRYSIYSGSYVSSCSLDTSTHDCVGDNCCPNNSNCSGCNCRTQCLDGYWRDPDQWAISGVCFSDTRTYCTWTNCWNSNSSTAPQPYASNGSNTFSYSTTINNLFNDLSFTCSASNNSVPSYKFWYSANNATGLLYKLSNSKTTSSSLGSTYNFASIQSNQSPYNNNNYKIIYNVDSNANTGIQYLQYSLLKYNFFNSNPYGGNTGGYVLNIKQTKCRRTNGQSASDSYTNRGVIQFVMVPAGTDPNNTTNPTSVYTSGSISTDSNGNGSIQIPAAQGANSTPGYLWLRINNNPDDYKDSIGEYKINFLATESNNSFNSIVANPLLSQVRSVFEKASANIFQNLTCSAPNSDEALCVNFFRYIRTMLALYVAVYAAMFLFGIIKVNQTDLLIRVVKIAIIAGLMNDSTFSFFNQNLFSLFYFFSDQIISDIGSIGFNSPYLTNNLSGSANPFSFADPVMSSIFFNKTFLAQLLSFISMGISGVLYLIIILVAVVIFVISILRAMMVYVISLVGVALLVSLAPIFLTFMLFQFTNHLFENWLKYLLKFMFEPIILLAGIIILTQLFTIYLDDTTGFSVCWKCVLPVKIPFPNIPGLSSLTNVPLFCINWFAPWGFDYYSGVIGMNLQNIVALTMIAYCCYNYTSIADQIASRILGNTVSAINVGTGAVSSIGQSALSTVGLDKNTREGIEKRAAARTSAKDDADKKARNTPKDTENKSTTKSRDNIKDNKNSDKE